MSDQTFRLVVTWLRRRQLMDWLGSHLGSVDKHLTPSFEDGQDERGYRDADRDTERTSGLVS